MIEFIIVVLAFIVILVASLIGIGFMFAGVLLMTCIGKNWPTKIGAFILGCFSILMGIFMLLIVFAVIL